MIQLENLKLKLLFFYYFYYYDTSDSDYSFLYHFPIIFDYFKVRRGIRVPAHSYQPECQDL